MNKLNPRYKINFQAREIIFLNSNFNELKKKKWKRLKIQFKYKNNWKNKIYLQRKIRFKPEKKKYFFQKRFIEKQKLKFFYGCLYEYQIKNYFKKLNKKKKKIHFFKKFLTILESCLDITIVRLRIVKNIFQAKQLINHKKIRVNDQIVNQPKYLLKEGDIITQI